MKIAVSACLLGEACRYDGRSKPCARVKGACRRRTRACARLPRVWQPSQAAHPLRNRARPVDRQRRGALSGRRYAELPCKRTPSREQRALRRDGTWPQRLCIARQQGSRSRRALLDDPRRKRHRRTAAYARGAGRARTRAKEAGCELAILKAKEAPHADREVYDGTFSGTLVPGWGIAAATFRDVGITVIDETADFSRLSRV